MEHGREWCSDGATSCCCATAAGPAFEGAGIRRARKGGVAGAIDSVWIGRLYPLRHDRRRACDRNLRGRGSSTRWPLSSIAGVVDDTGRMADADEAQLALPPAIRRLLEEGPRGPVAYLDRSRGIYLSQADVRAAQLAKAAIAAGIDTLLRLSGVGAEGADRLYLAGGFGSLLDVRSAARIGLIPGALADRVIVVGNASGAGATAACLSRRRLADCDRARASSTYVELSSRPDFNEAYVERMMFPEPA